MNDIVKMPEDFKGKLMDKGSHNSVGEHRRWTDSEVQWCLDMLEKGYTKAEIAYSVDRTEVSVSLKLKRMTKKNNTYNHVHIDDKYKANKDFIEKVNPKTILDVYCGENSFYKSNYPNISVITNDVNEDVVSDYHMDSLKLLCRMYINDSKFDVIDLDPFGSAYDCFDLAIKMAKKGLVITLGEMGHKRWKRIDYVSRFYNIKSLDDFKSEKLIEEIVKIGRKNKKNLIPYICKDWKHISRVWFLIEDYKVDMNKR